MCEYYFKKYRSYILSNGAMQLISLILDNADIQILDCDSGCDVKLKKAWVVKTFNYVK